MTEPDPDARSASDESPDAADANSTDREPTDRSTAAMTDQHSTADRQDSPPTDRPDADPEALFDDHAPADSPGSPVGDDRLLPTAGDDTLAKLYWGSLAAAVAFGAFALVRFYASVTAAIEVWIASEYQPLLQAAFNFAVLLAAGIVASVLLRRLRVRRG